MYEIGLTGGIASGKSVVARRLAERGAVLIDSDVLSREAVEPGMPALARLRDRFGDGIITPDGALDRAALGAIVFSDEAARHDLNAIVHPEVRRLSALREREARERDPHAVIVHDIPLLVESPARFHFDLVVVLAADEATRIERLVTQRGMSPKDAAARVAAQASEQQRLAIADVVIDTTGTLEQTLEQADAVYDRAVLAAAGSD
ncbi:dephospho-CoA kinase [Compostimonas suwonensis]|uniref:Dephospho-CoA kinase n=1 Tax=Compostimonas suwonensis TaxID=1048394 RepID=A0A2M9BYM8_9MICO|nr:dephospho-CoA kinase [Compostimonas suwonensis]PJJ63170.1 dephospho-CoA kinase [Compostimonas suwonensis]